MHPVTGPRSVLETGGTLLTFTGVRSGEQKQGCRDGVSLQVTRFIHSASLETDFRQQTLQLHIGESIETAEASVSLIQH